MSGQPRVAVIGAGAAGLAAALELCNGGVGVDLVSEVAPCYWPEAASGGIAGGAELCTADDGEAHLQDAVLGGDFLSPQAAVRALVEAAPSWLTRLAALGVPFCRDVDGAFALRRLEGASRARAAYAGALTSALTIAALDRALSRYREPALSRWSHHELASIVRDDDGVLGCVVLDRRTMRHEALPCAAVIVCGGGIDSPFQATPGAFALDTGLAVAWEAGAVLANAELVQWQPCALAGDSGRAVPAALRARARLWVPSAEREVRRPRDIPKDERDFFLGALHPGWGLYVPDDVAALAVARVCSEGRGVYDRKRHENEACVYLDAPAAQRSELALELDEVALAGGDLEHDAVRVRVAIATGLGALWVDHHPSAAGGIERPSPRNHATSLPGIYAAGDSACLYHGACRLSENQLLSALLGGELAGEAARAQLEGAHARDGAAALEHERARAEEALRHTLTQASAGDTGAIELQLRLAETLASLDLERSGESLATLWEDLGELRAVASELKSPDRQHHGNASALLPQRVRRAIDLAEAVTVAALARCESRGAHRRSDHPERSDTAQTTLVRRAPDGTAQTIQSFERNGTVIDGTVAPGPLDPRARSYGDSA